MSDMAVYGPSAAPGPAQARKDGAARPEGAEDTGSARVKQADLDSWRTKEEEQAPSLIELMAEAREKAEARRDAYKPKTKPRYGDAPLEAYARLARARTQADVSSAAGYARRRIVQLKTALRQDGESAEQIKAAIAQLQKAVLRAGRKKNDLNRESLTARRRERAQEEARRREAQRLKLELQRARSLRMIRERGYGQEAAIQNRLAAELDSARAEYQLPGQTAAAPSPSAAAYPVPAAGPQAPAPGGAEFTALA